MSVLAAVTYLDFLLLIISHVKGSGNDGLDLS
jgi:hypothetical protein